MWQDTGNSISIKLGLQCKLGFFGHLFQISIANQHFTYDKFCGRFDRMWPDTIENLNWQKNNTECFSSVYDLFCTLEEV